MRGTSRGEVCFRGMICGVFSGGNTTVHFSRGVTSPGVFSESTVQRVYLLGVPTESVPPECCARGCASSMLQQRVFLLRCFSGRAAARGFFSEGN